MSKKSEDTSCPTGLSDRYERVSTVSLPPDERFTIWRDVYLQRCEPFECARTDIERFEANYRYLSIPEGEFTDLSMTSAGLARPARLCRDDAANNIALTTTVSGSGAGWFSDPDLTTIFGTGYIRVRDQSRPYAVKLTARKNRTLHLEFPRASLDPQTLTRVQAAAGTAIRSQGLITMLAALMRSFADVVDGLDPATRGAGLRSVLDLAVTALRLEYGTAVAESEDCKDGMLLAAQTLMCQRIGEVDLSPEGLAGPLGCSRAHLYRVFARNGLTIAGYLREIRLQRCRAALAVAGPSDTVADIAFRCGFDNPVYFSRLFRQRFGIRPTDARPHD
jgi:AraC family transcriptional regulator, positive regulator of tynA and feaB